MSGVWYTTGGGGGAGLVILGLAAAEGTEWLLARLLWILGTLLLCAVLTAAAVRWLIVWSDRRAVRVWAQQPAQLHAAPVPPLHRPERAAIAPVHIHFHGLDDREQAAIIRQALPGRNEP